LCAALRKYVGLAFATAAVLLAGNASWAAGKKVEPAVRLLSSVPIPVSALNTTHGTYSYDISFVDQATGTYYLADRSNKFARTHDNKFAEIDHMIPECGAPVLLGAAAHFECRNEYRHYGGDHIIFIGHVELYAYTHKPTLLFCRGKYMRDEPLIPT
jgi:Flavin reductase like domain